MAGCHCNFIYSGISQIDFIVQYLHPSKTVKLNDGMKVNIQTNIAYVSFNDIKNEDVALKNVTVHLLCF